MSPARARTRTARSGRERTKPMRPAWLHEVEQTTFKKPLNIFDQSSSFKICYSLPFMNAWADVLKWGIPRLIQSFNHIFNLTWFIKNAVKLIPNLVGVKAMPRFLQRFSLQRNKRRNQLTTADKWLHMYRNCGITRSRFECFSFLNTSSLSKSSTTANLHEYRLTYISLFNPFSKGLTR